MTNEFRDWVLRTYSKKDLNDINNLGVDHVVINLDNTGDLFNSNAEEILNIVNPHNDFHRESVLRALINNSYGARDMLVMQAISCVAFTEADHLTYEQIQGEIAC